MFVVVGNHIDEDGVELTVIEKIVMILIFRQYKQLVLP